MEAYSLDVGQLTTQTCGANGCGIAFAIPSAFYIKKRQDGSNFYCPNGHSLVFKNSENEKLKRELAQAQKRYELERQAKVMAQAETERIEKCRRATKGALTKVNKRVAAGHCPFCSAKFPDLAAHVEAKHPAEGTRPQGG